MKSIKIPLIFFAFLFLQHSSSWAFARSQERPSIENQYQDTDLIDNKDFSGHVIRFNVWNKKTLNNATMPRALLVYNTLHETRIQGGNYNDVVIKKSFLNEMAVDSAIFNNATISGGKKATAHGISFVRTSMQNVKFNNIKMRMSNFSDSDLRHSIFSRVQLQGSTFENVNLSYSEFRLVNLKGVRFKNVNFKQVTFDHVFLYGAQIYDDNLQEYRELTLIDLLSAGVRHCDLTFDVKNRYRVIKAQHD